MAYARAVITHDDVRRIALGLPGAEERPSYGGRPSWRSGNRMFTWIRDDPEALVVWVASEDDKEALLAADADVFFTTSHYDGHPIVLVRLDHVDLDEAGGCADTPRVDDQLAGRDEASELIIDSWRVRAPARLVAAWDAAHD
jgi:hypothetical protein